MLGGSGFLRRRWLGLKEIQEGNQDPRSPAREEGSWVYP